MGLQKLGLLMLLALTASLAVAQAGAGATLQAAGETQRTHRACMNAAERVVKDARIMSPGRSWTWQLQAKDSLRHLDVLRRHLSALWDAQAAFEKSLAPEQISKFDSELQSIHQLRQHLDEDLRSLDSELKKGDPTRWHVAADLADIEKETHRYEERHEEIAAATGLRD